MRLIWVGLARSHAGFANEKIRTKTRSIDQYIKAAQAAFYMLFSLIERVEGENSDHSVRLRIWAVR